MRDDSRPRAGLWLDNPSRSSVMESCRDAVSQCTERRAATEDSISTTHAALDRSARNLRLSMERLILDRP